MSIEIKIISGMIKFYETSKEVKQIANIQNFSTKYHKLLNDLFKYRYIDPKNYDFPYDDSIKETEIVYLIDKFIEEKDKQNLRKLKLNVQKMESLTDFEEAIKKNKIKTTTLGKSNLIDSFDKEFFKKYIGKKIIGSPTGIRSLDETLDGIYGLTAVTGIPGTGKTTLAIQISINSAFNNDTPVIYLSLEIDKKMFLNKVVSYLSEIPFKDLLKNYQNYEVALKKYKAYLNVFNNDLFKVYDKTDKVTINDFKNIIYEVQKKYNKQPLVVIDYFNLYDDKNITKNLEKLSKDDKLMESLISLKNETNANFILIMGKNKQGYKTQDLSSIKGSGGLEYGLETILTLEDPENIGENFIEEANVVANIMKNRWGEGGINIPLNFEKTKSKFRDIN